MSEKSAAEKLKKPEKKERFPKKQTSPKSLVEDAMKKSERATEVQEKTEILSGTEATSKISTSDKPASPEAAAICEMPKTMTKSFFSDKLEKPEIVEVCELPKATSKSSTSNKPEKPEPAKVYETSKATLEISISDNKPEKPKVIEVCQIPKTTPEVCIFEKKPEKPKVVELCKMPKTTPEVCIFEKKPEKPKVTEVCEMPKTTPDISISDKKSKKPEVIDICEIPKTTPDISISDKKLEKPKVIEVCEMPKTTTDISISDKKSEKPEVIQVCEMPKTTTDISISDKKSEKPEIIEVCEIPKTTTDISISNKKSEKPEVIEVCEIPKTTPEVCIFEKKPEKPKVEERCKMPKTTPDISISDKKSEKPEVIEVCEMPKTTTEVIASIEFETPDVPKVLEASKIISERTSEISVKPQSPPKASEVSLIDVAASLISTSDKSENISELSATPEISETTSLGIAEKFKLKAKEDIFPKDLCEKKSKVSEYVTNFTDLQASTNAELQPPEKSQTATLITSTFEKADVLDVRRASSMSEILSSMETDDHTVPEVRRTQSTVSETPVSTKLDDPEDKEARKTYGGFEMSSTQSETQMKVLKPLKPISLEIPDKHDEYTTKESSKNVSTVIQALTVEEQASSKKLSRKSIRDMLRRRPWPVLSAPNFEDPHIVLATHHLVPSLPIELFEIFAEMIEVVTKRPVVLLHECRENRPIATEIVDIAILPPDETWDDSVLLPASFVFEHPLNKDKKANVYVDIIVQNDRALHIQDFIHLRGHRCAISHKRNRLTPAGLLENHLRSKGENMLFFGNVLDVRTQLNVLEIVLNKQAEAGIMESPVMRYHLLPERITDSIHVLASMGPLPPYRIMINKKMLVNPADNLIKKLTTYLLNASQDENWTTRLSPYNVIGFAENSIDRYCDLNKKSIVTKTPYY